MNNVVKLFVVASLGIGIFGGGGFVAYRLFFKKPDLRPGETNQPVVTPTPDPGIMMLEQAKRELDGGNKSNAEKILLSLIQDFPESAKVGDAKRMLGDLNVRAFFSPEPVPDKMEDVEARGY